MIFYAKYMNDERELKTSMKLTWTISVKCCGMTGCDFLLRHDRLSRLTALWFHLNAVIVRDASQRSAHKRQKRCGVLRDNASVILQTIHESEHMWVRNVCDGSQYVDTRIALLCFRVDASAHSKKNLHVVDAVWRKLLYNEYGRNAERYGLHVINT